MNKRCFLFLSIVSLLFLSFSSSAEWKPVAAHLIDKGESPIMVQASEQPSNTITLQYQTPAPAFKLVSYQNVNGTLTKRCFLGNAKIHSVPGEPEVPFIYSRIILPQGRTVESIKIVPKTVIESPGRHVLTYGEIPHTISSTKITWAKPSMSIYGSNAVYPAKTHELVDIQYRCGVAIAYMNIYPVRYMPSTGKLQYFSEFAPDFDILVTFNGKSFDAPFIKDRMVYHRKQFEWTQTHVDILHHSRRRWKDELPDCKLQTLESYICQRRRVGDVPGSLVPDVYREFVRSGSTQLLADVFHHNALDLITLVELTVVLLS